MRIDFFQLFSGLLVASTALAEPSPIETQTVALGGDKLKTFLVHSRKGEKPPRAGYGLLVVLPGGTGSADFAPFVGRILEHACPPGFLLLQPVAPKFTPAQKIVWPTENVRVDKQTFSTEAFVRAAIRKVGKSAPVDRRRILCMAWSSSGPAAYAMALEKKTLFSGFYISMSVFKPDALPSLKRAAKRRFYIEHSPQDDRCPYRMAKDAHEKLKAAGAAVRFVSYEGGHGWKGAVYPKIRAALDWLQDGSKKS